MRRRAFITLLGGAVTWPLSARTQQITKLPIIGFMGAATASVATPWLSALVQGLRDLGWVDGNNVAIDVRWALASKAISPGRGPAVRSAWPAR